MSMFEHNSWRHDAIWIRSPRPSAPDICRGSKRIFSDFSKDKSKRQNTTQYNREPGGLYAHSIGHIGIGTILWALIRHIRYRMSEDVETLVSMTTTSCDTWPSPRPWSASCDLWSGTWPVGRVKDAGLRVCAEVWRHVINYVISSNDDVNDGISREMSQGWRHGQVWPRGFGWVA